MQGSDSNLDHHKKKISCRFKANFKLRLLSVRENNIKIKYFLKIIKTYIT